MRLETGLEQGGQVVVAGFVPQLLEPLLHLTHHVRRVVAQVQFQIGGQPRTGEVRRTGHDTVRPVAHQERLAVQEAPLQPTHLHAARPAANRPDAAPPRRPPPRIRADPDRSSGRARGTPTPAANELVPPAPASPTRHPEPVCGSPAEWAQRPAEAAPRSADRASPPAASTRRR